MLGHIRQPVNWKQQALFGAAPKCEPGRVGVIGNSTCQGKSFNEIGVQGGLCGGVAPVAPLLGLAPVAPL